MRHLPATFAADKRRGAGVEGTVGQLQTICDEQGLTRPITELKESAKINV
jgi:hypothetical protein